MSTNATTQPSQSSSTWKAGALRRQGKGLFRRARIGGGGNNPASASPLREVENSSLTAKLRYWFDTALAKGPSVIIKWLGLLTLALIGFAAVVMTIFRLTGISGSKDRLGIAEAFWQSLLRVLDSGTFAGDNGWITRIVGLLVTLAGIFIAGSLIGLIANAVDQRIELLRRGTSTVLESGHAVILGWSERVPAIVSELIIANESEKKAAVVVLASAPKMEMEETLRESIGDYKTTRIVCRSGEPWIPHTLALSNVVKARSIVVIGAGSDAETVKVLLAIRAAGAEAPIIAEVMSNETARSLRSLFGERLVTVNSDDLVAELTAQACRQRGLSTVFRELLDFDGDEMYFANFPALAGHTYAQVQLAFANSSIVGRMDASGVVELNPPASTLIRADDELIGIAADDSLFKAGTVMATPALLPTGDIPKPTLPRRIIIVGWSDLGPRVIRELDEFLGPDATIEIMIDPTKTDPQKVKSSVSVSNVAIDFSEFSGGPEVMATEAAKRSFHEVVVLGYRGSLSPDEADSLTLLTLLAFRQVCEREGLGQARMVAELLDQRHAALAEASGADDFIVSSELTSLMLAQLSERSDLERVFADLFDRGGCSIELRPAAQYGCHHATTFAQIVATASAQGMSAIGFRRAGTGEVVVNPAKMLNPALVNDDEILVIAPGSPR